VTSHRRTARRRRTFRLIAFAICATAAAFPLSAEPVDLRARAISEFRTGEDPSDRVAFRGGLVLSGPRGFGGFSGLLVDGDTLLAVSDAGHWMAARMVLEDGRLVALADARLVPRLDVNGRTITLKRSGDAEALALTPGGVAVAIETVAQLLEYPAEGLAVDFSAAARRIPIDHPLRIAARRNGLEALVRLPDGRLLAFTEKAQGGSVAAFRGPEERRAVASADGWAVTGADILPGGDLLLLERRWRGGLDIGMRMRRIGSDAVAGEGPLDGPVLIEAGFSAEIDNMEAIAADVIDGRIAITVISDDNFNFLQRTLLLRFEIDDPRPVPNPDRALSRS
jgi:hypothetical protein